MRAPGWCGLAAAAALLLAPPAGAQDPELDQLAATVRAATAALRDTAAASAAGFRPFGPDFPTMGRHWVSVARVMEGGVDPVRPPILEYASIEGRTQLVGVGFATLVEADEVPAGLPVPPGAWHFHSGTLDEESFLLGHASHGRGAGPRVRIAVLHLWVWETNPDGLTATHNPGLPFRRLGLAVPDTPPAEAAAHAVALAAGAAPYYLAQARARGVTRATDVAEVAAALERGARRIGELLAAEPARALTPRAADAVVREWLRIWDEVEERTSTEVRRAAEPSSA